MSSVTSALIPSVGKRTRALPTPPDHKEQVRGASGGSRRRSAGLGNVPCPATRVPAAPRLPRGPRPGGWQNCPHDPRGLRGFGGHCGTGRGHFPNRVWVKFLWVTRPWFLCQTDTWSHWGNQGSRSHCPGNPLHAKRTSPVSARSRGASKPRVRTPRWSSEPSEPTRARAGSSASGPAPLPTRRLPRTLPRVPSPTSPPSAPHRCSRLAPPQGLGTCGSLGQQHGPAPPKPRPKRPAPRDLPCAH